MRIHLLLLLDVLVLTPSATRAASVKASLTPRFRFAEHSVVPISCQDMSNSEGRNQSEYQGIGMLVSV